MAPPTRLLLIRHGQSPLGREQAEKTARILAKEGVDAIYSSDLERAVQTAKPLSDLLGIPINKSRALRERHVGVLEGLTFDESRERFPRDYFALINRNIQHVITEGESYRQLLKRTTAELKTILKEHQGKRIAVFSTAPTGTDQSTSSQ